MKKIQPQLITNLNSFMNMIVRDLYLDFFKKEVNTHDCIARRYGIKKK